MNSKKAMTNEQPLNVLWTWLGWLHIKHYVIQRINKRWTPVLGLIMGGLVYFSPQELNIYGAYGVFYQVNGLLQILAGFFIASLAAVATFSRQGLDDVMGGDPPIIPRPSGRPEELTRRRFLCLLFGYLAGGTIILYLAGAAAMIVAQLVHEWGLSHPVWRLVLRSATGLLYGSALCNVLITSYLGLYFLIDRIHRPNVSSGFLNNIERQKSDSGNDSASY